VFLVQSMGFSSPKNIWCLWNFWFLDVTMFPLGIDPMTWGLQGTMITIEISRKFSDRSDLELVCRTWVIYIYDLLSIKTILFDILDFDVNLKRFDLWKHFRNVACSFHSWKFQRLDYYTAWSNSTKFVEKRDLSTHGQTCGHRFGDVIWRIPNPTLRWDWVFFILCLQNDFCKDPQVKPKFCRSLLTTKFVDVAPIGVVIHIWNLSWWQQLCNISKRRVRRTRRLLDQIWEIMLFIGKPKGRSRMISNDQSNLHVL